MSALHSSESNDAALLIRISGGDHLALLNLYDRYVGVLLALTQHIVGVGLDAEALIHDVFLEVWCRGSSYRPQHGTVRSWLILRTRSLALDYVRSQPDISQMNASSFLTDNEAAALDDKEFGQERVNIQQALRQLDETQQLALELAYFAALPSAEIAGKVDIPEDTLQQALNGVHHNLRHVLHDVPR